MKKWTLGLSLCLALGAGTGILFAGEGCPANECWSKKTVAKTELSGDKATSDKKAAYGKTTVAAKSAAKKEGEKKDSGKTI
jgi:hypothetical protein